MAIKKKWSIPNGDNPLIVYGLTILLGLAWFLCLFSFELEVGLQDGTKKTFGYKGWGDKLISKILK